MCKQKETNTLKQITHNNQYDISVLSEVNGKKKENISKITAVQNGRSSHTLGKKLDFFTKLFKNTNVKTFVTSKNISKLLSLQRTRKLSKYEKSGVYQLTCPTCDKKHIGQSLSITREISRTLSRLQVRKQQTEIRSASLRKMTFIRPHRRHNGYITYS